MEYEQGDKIDDQYTVLVRHRGGMSIVYVVLDEFSGKRFAVKTIKEELVGDKAAASRFELEAKTWMRLDQHPGIVQAMIYREIEGQPFLFLEYVDGGDLSSLLDQEPTLFVPQALDFSLQCCRAMAYVHGKDVGAGQTGVIHRDIKPGNILITRRRVAKITDFGLVKVFGAMTRLTATGIGLGTYFYMSPEQFVDAGGVDKPSDVYSMGVVMYQMLTGKLPITGENVGNLVHNITTRAPQAACSVNPDVPRPFSDVVMKCLEKAPDDRWQSFDDLQAELERVQRRLRAERAFVGRGRVCLRCEYRTLSDASECPVCGGSFVQATEAPERPDEPATVTAALPETALPEPESEPLPEPEIDPEAATTHFKQAVSHYQSGELKKALSELRLVVRLDPNHAKAQKGLQEVEKAVREEIEQKRAASPRIDWPMFRGNLARTGFTPEVVVPPLVERWQFDVGDWAWSSPAIAAGIVYVGGRIESGGMYGRLCAVDALTGKLVWEQQVGYEVNDSPTVAFGRVYVGFGQSICAFQGLDGEPIWRHPTRAVGVSSPTIFQDLLFAGCVDGVVYCLDSRGGDPRWTHTTGAAVYSSPLVWDGLVYVGSADSKLYALDVKTGGVVWTFDTEDEVSSSPTVFGDVVCFGSRDGNIYAVGQKTGKLRWRLQTGDEVYSSPSIAGGTLYVGSRDHKLYAIDAESGELKWEFETGDWVYASPAVADEIIYVGSYDKKLHAVDATTGESVWEVELMGEVRSSPAVAHGAVYVATNDGKLYCFVER